MEKTGQCAKEEVSSSCWISLLCHFYVTSIFLVICIMHVSHAQHVGGAIGVTMESVPYYLLIVVMAEGTAVMPVTRKVV